MLDFQIPRITSEQVEENRGSFAIEPLDRGFGYTFGNSLRRVLLSSLYYLNDKKKLSEIKLPFAARVIEKAALKKIEGTYVEELLRDAKLI